MNMATIASEAVCRLIEENTGAIIVDVRGGVAIVTDKRTWTSLSQKKF